MSDYSLEQLTPEHFDELAPLMLDAFGEKVGATFFRWKYLENPAGAAIGNIARSNETGEIVAFYGMIPELYRWGDEVRTVYQSCDTMTHSRHRRRGLFQKLALETYRQGREKDSNFLAYGFGGPTSTPGFLKMGWSVAFEVRFRFRPFPLTLIPRWHRRPRPTASPIEQALIDLICRASGERPTSAVRTAEFVRWRLSNPLRHYLAIADGDRAYAIFHRAGGALFLFDFWEREPGLGRAVWNDVRAASAKPMSKGVLTFCQPGIDFDRQMRTLWLLHNPFKSGPASLRTPFIVYGDKGDRDREDDWAITPFDHDSY